MIILFVMVTIAGLSTLIVLPISLIYNSDHDRIAAFKLARGYCIEPGCWRHGEYEVTECFFPDNYDWHSPDEILCYDHIQHSGFCQGCGSFWGGIESFDFRHPGWCDNCWYEIFTNDDDDYAEFWYDEIGLYRDYSDYNAEPMYTNDDDLPF